MTDPVYVDTSVIVALLATDDAHCARARRWLSQRMEQVITSVLSEVELCRALQRRGAGKSVRTTAANLLATLELVEITEEIRSVAIDFKPLSIRSLDAIHLATARVAALPAFATFDVRQESAAVEAGFHVPLREKKAVS